MGSWFGDAWDTVSGWFGGGDSGGSSWLGDIWNWVGSDSAWNKPGTGSDSYWDGALGSLFSPQSIMGAIGTGANYFGQQSALDMANDRTDQYYAWQQQLLDWQKQKAAEDRAAAEALAAQEAEAAKEIAAMQIEAQKAIAAYNQQVQSAMQRTQAKLTGTGNTSDALVALGQLATRPYL